MQPDQKTPGKVCIVRPQHLCAFLFACVLSLDCPGGFALHITYYFQRVHTFQAVSCYRSAGSLPIPTPAKPVVKKWIKLNKYKEDTEDLELEGHDTFPKPSIAIKHVADMTVILGTCESVPKVTIITSLLCPPPPPPRPKQQCTKHSRCHCDLLGTETEDFFRITE